MSVGRWVRQDVAAVAREADVVDQDDTCPHGSRECARPGSAPCFECLVADGGESNGE